MIHFIINGKSGSGMGSKVEQKISEILNARGIEHSFYRTEYPKHATELAKQLSESGAKTIVAVGGDGTIHEVLNGLDVEKVNLGIIPVGSGNDFIESVKIPLNVEKSLALIIDGEAKETDFLVCDGIRCANIVGTGIDVEILERCERNKILKGKIKYFCSLIVSLIKFKFYDFKLRKGDETQDRSAMIVCCCNGKFFGGGIPMCPNAEPADNQMDFIIVNRMKKSKMIGYLIKLMKGKILEQEFCDYVRQDHAEAIFDHPISIEIDGEIYRDIKFDVHIEKGKLKLFRP
ncbi:MAG: diacylglycerol kinase family lipid kinase [Clostridia bacterium]|nr:diacylglycerol kinase family lipid kinase [Clostridia bacterium]